MTGPKPKELFFGRVHFYYKSKGWGFIVPDDTEVADVFVHHSTIRTGRNLERGQRVVFEIEKTDRGVQAVNVWVVEEEKSPSGSPQASVDECGKFQDSTVR
jgi:cold shock protein